MHVYVLMYVCTYNNNNNNNKYNINSDNNNNNYNNNNNLYINISTHSHIDRPICRRINVSDVQMTKCIICDVYVLYDDI